MQKKALNELLLSQRDAVFPTTHLFDLPKADKLVKINLTLVYLKIIIPMSIYCMCCTFEMKIAGLPSSRSKT